MTTEQERLEKAKQKLMIMNKKVLHAQNISKKRNTKKPELEPLSPAPSPPPAARPKQNFSNTYLFELTESMIMDGFSEDEVAQYVKRVENDSKCTDLELDQHEILLNAELKKINRNIRRIKDPKPETPQKNEVEDEAEKDDSDNNSESKDSSPKQKGYAEIQMARNGQEPEKQDKAQNQPSEEDKKRSPSSKQTPKRSKLPARKKNSDSNTPGTPAVQATGAGAKFLADLLNDDDEPMPF